MPKTVWIFLTLLFVWSSAFAQQRHLSHLKCEEPYSLCTERRYSRSVDPEYKGRYIGHDEPSLLFYSEVPGSGNYNRYTITLPRDPDAYPTDASPSGKGRPTVWNFQLHPAFWFGMAMCDTESDPEYTRVCEPDTDENIFDDPNPKSKNYIGRHPGTAFMEMQFYPPGWVNGFTQTQYAAAINIFSVNIEELGPKGPVLNNSACQKSVGLEPGNFALITLDGKSQAPGDPLTTAPNAFAVIPGKTLLMNPGDKLSVTMKDTRRGFKVTIHDLTTGETGSMTASVANGFAQVVFDPDAKTCTSRPYAFHPMYATSGPHTRVPWAVHSYNIAFSDEIGHFNYCDLQDDSTIPGIGACLVSPVEKEVRAGKHEIDDFLCFDTASSVGFGALQPLGGCLDSDNDFDGIPYHHAWPGSGRDPYRFSAVPEPVRFTSPKFKPAEDDDAELRGYSRVAFEADMPAIELSCKTSTGVGCVNPPPDALFYPLYTTTIRDGRCWWQFGARIPGTKNAFGRSSVTEFAHLEASVYITGTRPHPGSAPFFENFNRVLPNNPCP
jgi:hypothetical protein